MRAFIAIELPPEVKNDLADVQQRLKQAGLKARWVKPGNIHLTLKFLGDIDPGNLENISAAMKVATEKHAPFELKVSGTGVFPNLKKARVLWAGLSAGVTELINLQKDLDKALVDCGFECGKRAFKGHLTLARFRGRVNPAKLEEALKECDGGVPAKWMVDDLVLFKSDLMPTGAIYSQLATQRLGS